MIDKISSVIIWLRESLLLLECALFTEKTRSQLQCKDDVKASSIEVFKSDAVFDVFDSLSVLLIRWFSKYANDDHLLVRYTYDGILKPDSATEYCH